MAGRDATLTIGELARLAGVTTRAVRHYHQYGLLPEPERDLSGYRRYGAGDVVDLIRIRTLAEAGVPLARVAGLLAADAGEFAGAVADIDRQLRDDVRRLQRRRARVGALRAGEGLALPEVVVDYLDRLREAGLSEAMIELERDGWILLSAHAPDLVAQWIGFKRGQLDRPGFLEFYRRLDEAYGWDPDDPRLVGLADDVVAALATLSDDEQEELRGSWSDQVDPRVAEVLDEKVLGPSPAWARLNELLAERGAGVRL